MKYFIDKDKRTIVAVMSAEFDENGKSPYTHALEYITGRLKRKLRGDGHRCTWAINDLCGFFVKKYIDSYTYFYGKAVCSPNDEWDEEKGKEVARARALESFYKEVRRACDDISDMFNELGDMTHETSWKANDSYNYWFDKAEYQKNPVG